MHLRRAAIVLACAVAVVAGPAATPASGWSPAGHMVLGAVAYRQLQRIDPAALEAALEENVRRLASESEVVRAVALTWVFHLVTDLHQLLHDIALVDAARPGGDRGGNLTFVRVEEGATTVDLHWLWDQRLLAEVF